VDNSASVLAIGTIFLPGNAAMIARFRHRTRRNDRKGMPLFLLVQIACGHKEHVAKQETQQESEYAR
jgi:hypothetical protein